MTVKRPSKLFVPDIMALEQYIQNFHWDLMDEWECGPAEYEIELWDWLEASHHEIMEEFRAWYKRDFEWHQKWKEGKEE